MKIKKLTHLKALLYILFLTSQMGICLDNGLGRVPPMGFNNWPAVNITNCWDYYSNCPVFHQTTMTEVANAIFCRLCLFHL